MSTTLPDPYNLGRLDVHPGLVLLPRASVRCNLNVAFSILRATVLIDCVPGARLTSGPVALLYRPTSAL